MIKNMITLCLILVTTFVAASEYRVIKKHIVINELGKYTTNDNLCTFEIAASGMGGYYYTTIGKNKINDITGFAYLGEGRLVYTTSPMYGDPGIYIINCKKSELSKIISAKNKNSGYPLGTDYFELESVNSNKIFFYYHPDIDKDDFDNYKTPKNIFQTDYAGKTFKRADAKKK